MDFCLTIARCAVVVPTAACVASVFSAIHVRTASESRRVRPVVLANMEISAIHVSSVTVAHMGRSGDFARYATDANTDGSQGSASCVAGGPPLQLRRQVSSSPKSGVRG